MANGNFAGGDGTEQNPYLIEDAWDLNAVRNNLSAHYKLISDIDLDISPFNEGEGWNPIGDNSTSSNRFSGVFNGENFIIKNLYINRPNTNYMGLFGFTNGATIKNIGVESVNVTGNGNTGGLVGRNYNSSIKNSYSKGSVTGNSNTGGLVGQNYISSVIENSYFTGSVTGSSSYTGGLVGRNYNSSVIENSYFTGSVTGNSYTGGLVGYNYNSSIVNSYWDKETSGYTTSEGGVGLTTKEMQTAQLFIEAGWENEKLENGTLIWKLKNGKYPKLWFEKTDVYYYSTKGTYTSPIIDLGTGWKETKLLDIVKQINTGATDILIETASSSDGMSFTEYLIIDSSVPPQGRYLKIRVTLIAQGENEEDKVLEFDQSSEENTVTLNEFVQANGDLSLKTSYLLEDNSPTPEGNGNIYKFTINKASFKKIKGIAVN